MKKKHIVGCVAIPLIAGLIAGSAYLIKTSSDQKKLKEKLTSLPENFTLTAHTGCSGTADNSLEAIEAGARAGADIVEFDLNFATGGKPVLAHDAPKGNEITLDEAFKKVSEYPELLVNVDAKSISRLGEVCKLAKKHGLEERIFFTGIEQEDTGRVKKDAPGVPYYLNVSVEIPENQTEEYLDELVKTVKNSGAVGINFNKSNATPELVQKFRENGLLVSIWTVNKKKDMFKILSLCPDNITTREPAELAEIINENK